MTRITLRALLKGASEAMVREIAGRWCRNGDAGHGALPREEALRAAAAAMEDNQRVDGRMQELPRKLADLFEAFLDDPGSAQELGALFQRLGRNFKSRFDLEASLAALQREGFLFATRDKRWSNHDAPVWAVPGELADCVLGMRQRRQRALKDIVTLQGFLDARYFRERGGEPGDQKAADHQRKIYKLYLMESSITSRIRQLPADVRRVFDLMLARYGGILPHAELVRELDSDDVPDLDLCRKCLEETLLGSAGALDLARFGVQPLDSALVLFHEVTLAALQQHAAQNVPQVGDVLRAGVDLTTNVARFLKEIGKSRVQFTTDGDLFKASRKRIAGLMLPLPGNLMTGEDILEFLFRFCLHRRLIDRRGERALRPTAAGSEFERAPLQEQLKQLLSYSVEERGLPGEQFHQARLRRVLLRLLKRAEPEQWQEIQFLPFLARNTYFSQLDTEKAEEFFAARFQGGGYTPGESPQQLVWNLVQWIKRRLYPLGVVDLGLREGRPVALRLSRLGAELLEAEPAGKVGGVRCSVIVNPDFEVLLFPGDDLHQVVHLFDRFSRRLKSDHVHQFRLTPDALQAGLRDGLTLAQVLAELCERARVPIPQNVVYTLEEWAGRS